MRKILSLFYCIVLCGWCVAAPLRFVPVAVVQPCGDTLHCFASGDEFYNWLHDAEGFTIVRHPKTGQYVYADRCDADPSASLLQYGVLPQGLCASPWVPGIDNPAKAGLEPSLMPTRAFLQAQHTAWNVPKEQPSTLTKSGSPFSGTLNNVVIFIRFADDSVCTSFPFSTINGMFNDSSASSESLFNYFHHSSYGSLRVVSYYLPAPAGNVVLSYQDSHPRNYFQPYDATTNPGGYNHDTVRRNREFTLLQNAVGWVNANCAVGSLPNLDLDNDNMVDNVCFVVSGTYTGWNNLLWPHKWSIFDRTVLLGSKRIYSYNFQLAGSGTGYFNVSTLCHEMTHTLGAPDLYHYDCYNSISPAGAWDLMNSNQSPPQQTNSMFKLLFTNWFDSIPQITDSGEYTLQSLASGPNHAVRVSSAVPHEWYVLEYRNVADTFDVSIPNRGLLIWRYNDRSGASNSGFDFSTTPHQLWLFRPGSAVDTVNGFVAQAAFGVGGRSVFNASSNPHPYLCDGTPDSSFSITNIHINGPANSSVTFTFTPHGRQACPAVDTFPVAQDFESGDAACWTVQCMSASNSAEAGVVQTANGVTPHAGAYQFRFSSFHRATDFNQYLVSPRLRHGHPLQLGFWCRRSNSATENLRVLCSTTSNSPVCFTDTVADFAIDANGWQQRVVTIPPQARYVALNYYSDYAYRLLVDDIVLRDTVGPDTLVRDTVFVHVQDTAYRSVTDTMVVWLHDTVTTVHHDTLSTHVVDTLFFSIVDTVERTAFDTMPYAPQLHEVAILPNEASRGRTSGSGFFLEGTRLEIAAIALPGYRFDHWMDGNRDNPRTITVTSDMMFNAHFAARTKGSGEKAIVAVTDTIVVHDTVWLTLHDTVTLTLRDTLHLHVRDTFLHVLRDTLWLPLDEHDTFFVIIREPFPYDTTSYLPLTVQTADPLMGQAAGSGLFPYGTAVQLGALPAEGYHFVRWSDGATENPHTIHVEASTLLTAEFAPGETVGITQPSESPTTRVFTLGSRIVAEAPAALPIAIYNMLGQPVLLVGSGSDHTIRRTESSPLRPGLYIVRIGNLPASKVIVLEQ